MAEATKALLIPDEIVMNKIYPVRGQKIMPARPAGGLDRDLAELYEMKSIRLREQVKRNMSRFPENFMFQLEEKEAETMVSQNAITIKKTPGWLSAFCIYGTRRSHACKYT
jgi:hypothetical protein